MNIPFPKSTLALLASFFLLVLGTAGCNDNPVDAATVTDDVQPAAQVAVRAGEEFSDAEVFFERNFTDNDLGLQIFLDADGWEKVDVSDPANHKIFQLITQGTLSQLGITELRFESEEPSPAEVLALFPPGEYTFTGKTVEGDFLMSTGELSHDFVPQAAFTPANGAMVDPNNTVITWNAPGAEQVEIIIESEENDNVLDVILEGSSGSLNVPPQFLEPGTEYKIELLYIHENGNKSIVEQMFTTS